MNEIKTKICGITRIEDATASLDAGADAIGLNFYSKSKRFIENEVAQPIADSVRGQLSIVGVFVNSSVEEICNVVHEVGLDFVQLHGDETPDFVHVLRKRLEPTRYIIRAIRVPADDLEFAQREIDRWESVGTDMLLFDPASSNEFGGTGKQLDWSILSMLSIQKPWLLAGGLNPSNVSAAIIAAKPTGADVASGVEIEPGLKDREAITNFVRNSKHALQQNLSHGL